MTLRKSYENWQKAIQVASHVEVSVAQVYLCLEMGIPYTQPLYDTLHTRIATLRALLTEIEADVQTLRDMMEG